MLCLALLGALALEMDQLGDNDQDVVDADVVGKGDWRLLVIAGLFFVGSSVGLIAFIRSHVKRLSEDTRTGTRYFEMGGTGKRMGFTIPAREQPPS
jgi:hypothetical protein